VIEFASGAVMDEVLLKTVEAVSATGKEVLLYSLFRSGDCTVAPSSVVSDSSAVDAFQLLLIGASDGTGAVVCPSCVNVGRGLEIRWRVVEFMWQGPMQGDADCAVQYSASEVRVDSTDQSVEDDDSVVVSVAVVAAVVLAVVVESSHMPAE